MRSAPGLTFAMKNRNQIRNTRAAMANADVLNQQETKLQYASFDANFPNFVAYHNPYLEFEDPVEAEGRYPYVVRDFGEVENRACAWEDQGRQQRRAGCTIWVRETFMRNFEVKHTILEQGYVHFLVFRPRAAVDIRFPVFTKSFTVVNIYFEATDKVQKIRMVNKVRDFTFATKSLQMAGDTNIRLLPGDSNSGTVIREEKEAL